MKSSIVSVAGLIFAFACSVDSNSSDEQTENTDSQKMSANNETDNKDSATESFEKEVKNDTDPCVGKSEGDTCISTIVNEAYCSEDGTAITPVGGCDGGGGEDGRKLYCIPHSDPCPAKYILFCQNDSQEGDVLMVERFVCSEDDPNNVKCVSDRTEVSQNCNDRIGDTFCGLDEQKEMIFEIDAMICQQHEYGAQCSVFQSHKVVDCALSEKRCEEEIEKKLCFGENEDLGDFPLGNLPEKIINQTASCAQPEPCYKKESGDPCVPEEPARCVGVTLYKDTGICANSEMKLRCITDKEECVPSCVEDDKGAHCSEE